MFYIMRIIAVFVLLVYFKAQCSAVLNLNRVKRQDGNVSCLLPPQPDNGVYSISGETGFPIPGTYTDQFSQLEYKCQPKFVLNGESLIYCIGRKWIPSIPKCLNTCEPLVSSSLRIDCIFNHVKVPCEKRVTAGTRADIQCKPKYKPYGFGRESISCRSDGTWERSFVVCTPECGTVPPKGTPYVISGVTAEISDYPWHVAVYDKDQSEDQEPAQICGGSIVSANVIISAAHCFWIAGEPKPRKKESFAVGFGKVYRKWMAPQDRFAHYSNIDRLIIHPDYLDIELSFANDIAVMFTVKLIEFTDIIKPVCVQWTQEGFVRELTPGTLGKVAGWGWTTESGNSSTELQEITLPIINREECRKQSDLDFRQFITADKICAGYLNGSNVCHGDSGGGLCIPEILQDNIIYFLRGIVSVGPRKGLSCNSHRYTAFTSVLEYLSWLKDLKVHREPSVFGCSSGESITSEAACNGIQDCQDGSDETDAACKNPSVATSEKPIVQVEYCNMPPFPRNGSYSFERSTRIPTPDTLVEDSETLEFFCDSPYVLSGEAIVTCTRGQWAPKLPQCLEFAAPTDCSYIASNVSGIYEITPSKAEPFNVTCDMNFLNSKWTVIQNRVDGHVDFYRSYKEYQDGFGDLDGEFWLGLDHIYEITKSGSFELFILLMDFKNQTRFARYGEFSIGPAEGGYRLKVQGYAGDAGDSLSSHNVGKFTTKDHDEDLWDKGNCAAVVKGAWWYTNCFESNLNGLYLGGPSENPGMEWSAWHFDYSLKESKMLIRNTVADVTSIGEVKMPSNVIYPEDCANIQNDTSGIYKIKPKGSSSAFSVFCDMTLLNLKWTVIQNRMDGKVNFYRKYKDYEQGFGDLSGEHWLGLRHIHEITKNGTFELYVELSDFTNDKRFVRYGLFSLNSASDGYRLNIDDYIASDAGDSLTAHNGFQFSTYDHDVDNFIDTNCAHKFQGAWWFNQCFASHLNGAYLHEPSKVSSSGIVWNAWKGLDYSLKSTRMLIRNADAGKDFGSLTDDQIALLEHKHSCSQLKSNAELTMYMKWSIISSLETLVSVYTDTPVHPADCSDVKSGSSGVFEIQPNRDGQPFLAYCDFDLLGRKWTVIQSRFRGNVFFNQQFVEYQNGFGDPRGDHWLGLDHIYEITKNGAFNLYINITDFNNNSKYAHYEDFRITSEEDGYRLKIGKYSGNAGDSLRFHNGLPFSTEDLDRDTWSAGNCAKQYQGGWWFHSCHESNLNGLFVEKGDQEERRVYGNGITWFGWRDDPYYSYKATKMLITRKRA